MVLGKKKIEALVDELLAQAVEDVVGAIGSRCEYIEGFCTGLAQAKYHAARSIAEEAGLLPYPAWPMYCEWEGWLKEGLKKEAA